MAGHFLSAARGLPKLGPGFLLPGRVYIEARSGHNFEGLGAHLP